METSKKATTFSSTERLPLWVKRTEPAAPWTYEALDRLQREIAARGSEAILLSEVDPVVTLGRRAAREGLATEGFAPGQTVLPISRGGLETWHGLGHWVVFPVVRLSRFSSNTRGVRECIDALLAWGLNVCREFVPEARVEQSERLGIWSNRGKLVSVGVEFRQGRLFHGLGINVWPHPLSFRGVNPCGLRASVDYLGGPSQMEDVARSIVKHCPLPVDPYAGSR